MQERKKRVVVYGADWCGVTKHTRQHLDDISVAYEYINVEQDAAASQWVKDQNNGKEMKPTLDIEGEVLSAPRDYMLDDALKRHGLLT